MLEQAERLEDTGAGIQLSPNATRTLIGLGFGERLRAAAIAPIALRVLNAANGREIVRMPLGAAAEEHYGAPYWVVHRGDLQAALADAVARRRDITLKLGVRVEDYVTHPNGVTVLVRGAARPPDERGDVLLGADGLWSQVRHSMGERDAPRFAGRTAWRGLVVASAVPPEFREPLIYLWLGRDAHLVHYPVKGGRAINIVVITADSWNAPGWSEPAGRAELVPRLAAQAWAQPAQALVRQPDAWLKWALYDRPPLRRWSKGPVALLGDAAHPMLPYLAQGAAMAIEDAVVVAQCLAQNPDDAAAALRTYGAARRGRAQRVARLAARNGEHYHRAGIISLARDAAMRALGGRRLLQRYSWIYGWQPPPTPANS